MTGKNSTTLIVKKNKRNRVSMSRDPLYELCRRVFRDAGTQRRAKTFLEKTIDRKANEDPLQTSEWNNILKEFDISRSSFYNMRNQLLGAGLIEIRNNEYHPSIQFSKDLKDMADWWENQVKK